MKNSLIFILLLFGTLILSMLLPWWIIAPLALCAAYFSEMRPAVGFSLSFLAIFCAWVICAFMADNGTIQAILGTLFNVSEYATPFISGAIGGLTAGLFGLAGSLLVPKKTVS